MTKEQIQLLEACLDPDLSMKIVHCWGSFAKIFNALSQTGALWVRMEAHPDMTYFKCCMAPAVPAAMEMNPN